MNVWKSRQKQRDIDTYISDNENTISRPQSRENGRNETVIIKIKFEKSTLVPNS